jgi:hypothetical protein
VKYFQVDLGSAGGQATRYPDFRRAQWSTHEAGMAQSASFAILSGRTLTCKPRYKRQAGELNAYWAFCLRLNDVDWGQNESGPKTA